MTGKDLFDSVEFIGDDLIYDARFAKARPGPWRGVLSAAAVLALLVSGGALLARRHLPLPVPPSVQEEMQVLPAPPEEQERTSDVIKSWQNELSMQVPAAMADDLLVDEGSAIPFRFVDGEDEVWSLELADRSPGQQPDDFTGWYLYPGDFVLGWDAEHFYVVHVPDEPPADPDSFLRHQIAGYSMLLDFLDRNGITPELSWTEAYEASIPNLPEAVPAAELAAHLFPAERLEQRSITAHLKQDLLTLRLTDGIRTVHLQYDANTLKLTYLYAAEGENALLPCPAEDVPGFWRQALDLPEDWVLQDQTPLQGEPCIWYVFSKSYPVPGTDGICHHGEEAVLIVDRDTGALHRAHIARGPAPIWQPDREPLTREQALDAISDLLLPYDNPILGTELCFSHLQDGAPDRLTWIIDAAKEVTHPGQTQWSTFILDAYTGELLDASVDLPQEEPLPDPFDAQQLAAGFRDLADRVLDTKQADLEFDHPVQLQAGKLLTLRAENPEDGQLFELVYDLSQPDLPLQSLSMTGLDNMLRAAPPGQDIAQWWQRQLGLEDLPYPAYGTAEGTLEKITFHDRVAIFGVREPVVHLSSGVIFTVDPERGTLHGLERFTAPPLRLPEATPPISITQAIEAAQQQWAAYGPFDAELSIFVLSKSGRDETHLVWALTDYGASPQQDLLVDAFTGGFLGSSKQ